MDLNMKQDGFVSREAFCSGASLKYELISSYIKG